MDVTETLRAAAAAKRSTDVAKDQPITLDLGNFAAMDPQPIDRHALRSARGGPEAFLKQLTRDNTQLYINAMFSLPARRTKDGTVVVDVPLPQFQLPRAKPVPKAKPETRWQKFAKAKGIKKQKRSRMVFDEATQEWKPRFGYKRANDDQNDWLIPVPGNADPYEDQFAKRAEEKKARVAKNKANQLRNLARAGGKGGAGAAAPAALDKLPTAVAKLAAAKAAAEASPRQKNPAREIRKKELREDLTTTRTATASYGRFDKEIANEPKLPKHERRHFAPTTGNLSQQRLQTLELANKVASKVAKATDPVNARKAANLVQKEQEARRKAKASASSAGKKRKGK